MLRGTRTRVSETVSCHQTGHLCTGIRSRQGGERKVRLERGVSRDVCDTFLLTRPCSWHQKSFFVTVNFIVLLSPQVQLGLSPPCMWRVFYIHIIWQLPGHLAHSRCLVILNVSRLGHSYYPLGCEEETVSMHWRLLAPCLESNLQPSLKLSRGYSNIDLKWTVK